MSDPSLDRAEDGGERRVGFRAAGASLSRIVGPIIARHGSGIVPRLKSQWAAIVGPELGVVTWPEALARSGTLKLRVAPARALEVQHRAPLIVERINLFFGRDAVTRLALIQGPLPLPLPVPPSSSRALGSSQAAMLEAQLAGIRSPELREALTRLGRRVMSEPR